MNFDTIESLRKDFLLALNMSSVPDFCKVKPDHIFDEAKSVRWNREEAIRVNNEYNEKCKILRAERDVAISLVTDRIKKYISINVGCSLQRASLIWDFVYSRYHSNTIELFDRLEEFEELFENYERIC